MKITKKISKKILAIVLVAAMLVTPWSTAKASTYTSLSYSDGHTVVDGVDYSEYTVYGSTSGHSETAHILEFNPNDGYIPMAFAASAGNTNVLSSQYSTAVNKYGYEVAGVINGSYFDMTTGTLNGMLISGGKVSCADIGYTYGNLTDVVAFGYDGSMNIIQSQLAYQMYINGTLVPDALRFINKQQSSDGWRTDAIYYYDTSCGSTADSSTYGYEVVCKKVNGTDLVVGETMVAEVIQINGYTSGSAIDNDSSIKSDNFVLSTPSGSSYVSYLSGLSVGDKVEISVEETVAASKEIMENASSVITNVGCLVKDGVDLTDSTSYIGEHSVTGTYSCWTAFGTKPDGTYVFFTSEGGSTGDTSQSLTLRDVASAMINLGCTNVIRMDGGGSTAMYLSNTGSGYAGYAMSSSRAVADCIMVVKNNAGKPTLKAALRAAEKISHTDYTAAELVEIRAVYEAARGVYYNGTSTDADYVAAADALNALISRDAGSAPTITDGDPFWLTHYNNIEAEGAGTVMTSSYSGGAWYLHVAFSPVAGTPAYEITAISDGTKDGSGKALAIPEGGFVYTINKGNDWPVIYAANPSAYSWASSLPDYTSDACNAAFEKALTWKVGDQFIFNGLNLTKKTVPTTTSSLNWYNPSYNCTAVMASYVPEEGVEDNKVSNGIYITDFNSSITAGDCVIFTNEFNGGWISTVAANHNWTYNVILTWDDTVGAYVVTEAAQGVGDATPTYYIAENMIMIAGHNDETSAASANHALLANAQVGQVMNVYGVDIASRYLSVAPYVTFSGEVEVDPEPETPVVPEPTPDPEPTPEVEVITESGKLTYANGWDWNDGVCYQNQIFVYASSSSSDTPASIHGMGTGFLGWQNGIVLEYNSTTGKWEVVISDFEADGTNAAESAKLGSNRMAVIFHNEASVGQKDSYDFFVNYAKVGAEFVLTGSLSTLQSASGSISGVSLSYSYEVEVEPETPVDPEPETPVDPEPTPDPEPETPVDPEPTPDPEPETPVEPEEPEVEVITESGKLTYANGWDWSDSVCYQNQIFVYASSSSSDTPASIHGMGTGFLGWQNGIVLEYNSTNGKWEVVISDFEADGTNAAESAKLGSNRMAVIFHNEASVGQKDSYDFFVNYAKVGAEFTLTGSLSTLQSASGSISGVTLSYSYEVEVEPETPVVPEPTPDPEPETPVEPEEPEVEVITESGKLTYANGWDWSDSVCYQNQIFVYASSSSSNTPASIHGMGTGFLGWQNGIVLEYNSTSGKWEVVISDFEADGTNAAESAKLGSNRMAVIFHNEASVGQKESYEFFKNYAKVGAEFTLTGSLSTLQSASGKVSGVTLSYSYEVEVEPETPVEPEEPKVEVITETGKLTYANGWDWSDSVCYQNQIFVYASSSSSDTPASIHGMGTGFLGWQNGIVLEYNSTSGKWEVVISDFEADGTNAAESAKLGSNRIAVIFHNEASVGQKDSYEFFKNYAKVGAEFTLTGSLSTLQSASGKISGVSLSYSYEVEVEP